MSTIPAHEIVIIPYGEHPEIRMKLRQQCYDVRFDVFHHEQGFPLEVEIDESVLPLIPIVVAKLIAIVLFVFLLPA